MQDKKVILITGCSSGIGLVTAIKFATEGYKVYAGVRNDKSDGTQRLLHLAEEQSLDVQLLRLDITSEKNVLEVISLIEKKEGKIDVLVNNAGFGALGPLEAFSVEEIKEQYETNVFGTIRMIQAVTPLMRKQKNGYMSILDLLMVWLRFHSGECMHHQNLRLRHLLKRCDLK